MLKNRIRFSSTVDHKLSEALKELSEQTKIPQSKLIDIAIELVLEKYNYKPENKV